MLVLYEFRIDQAGREGMFKFVAGAIALLLFCVPDALAAEADGCDSSAALTYVCGPINAEDLVLVPDTKWILSSAMTPGAGIYLVNSANKEWTRLYTGSAEQIRHDPAMYGSCVDAPVMESFITHGLHLRSHDDGHATLYVVGHGGREAIEVFDVNTMSASPELTWRGCIPMPEGLAANSVTSLRDGSLLATVLMHPGQTFADVFAGKPTGAIYQWSPGDSGFVLIPGSELPGNNGIEISADEREIFVVSTGLRTISVFENSHPTRLLRSTQALDFGPDNVHMTADGQLITAGPSVDDHNCGELDPESVNIEEFASCPKGSVAAIFDPQTLAETARWSSPADPRFSNATMALQAGDEVWIGSFSGNRIGVFVR
jgi:hypothetical protein